MISSSNCSADPLARGTTPEQRARTKALALELAKLAKDYDCSDIRLLDVRDLSEVMDWILVVSGTSDRQMRSVADLMKKHAREQGQSAWQGSRDEHATWIVLDFVDLVVHLFEPNQRAWYDIEGLWGDAEDVELNS